MITAVRVLRVLNYAVGIPLIVGGFAAYIFFEALIPLLIALALVVVGPLEDLLKRYLHLPWGAEADTQALVDQGTSLAFVILLLAAMFLAVTGR